MTPKLKFVLVLLLLLSVFVTLADTNSFDPTATDVKIQTTIAKYSAWKFLIVPVTLILVAGVKKGLKKIPTAWLPWISVLIGAGIDQLASKFGFWTSSVEAGLAMGGLATWAHQAFIVQPGSDEQSDSPTTPT